METTYYTFTAREIVVTGDAVRQVSGGSRRLVCVREAARPVAEAAPSGKVIDLAAWKADREELQPEPEWEEPVEEKREAARPRRDHRRAVLVGGELLATLSVIGVMAILALRMMLY